MLKSIEHPFTFVKPLFPGARLIVLISISFNLYNSPANAQEEDTLKTLEEVVIRAFEQNESQRSGIVTRVLEINNAGRDQKSSFVQGFNTIPGVRMEERSPGSYRINIRGSSVRSPFGVRNVKIYWNGLPLTDAGGNTYFNQLAYNNFSYLEIHKGPASSMYGAGTGGLVLIHNLDRWEPGVKLEYLTGSFQLHNVFASARFGSRDQRNQLSFSHNQSEGYRVQSAMRRDNFSWYSKWKSSKQELSASFLFTDMHYETPGALTLSEFNINPKAARPSAGGFPSAVNAGAAIFQQNLLAGLTHSAGWGNRWKQHSSLYGVYNQVKNPAIRNYERRKEPGFGGRTVLVFNIPGEQTNLSHSKFQFLAGSEFSEGFYNIRVSKNVNAKPDSVRTDDDVRNSNSSFFLQADASIRNEWFFTAGGSLNFSRIRFTRLSTYPVTEQEKKFRNEIAPRMNIRRIWNGTHTGGLTISKGFSPPTLGELLPSNSVINTELEAEQGWNYEINAGTYFFKTRLFLGINAFYFNLRNALVQRRDLSGADFFVNAGETKQKGFEFSVNYNHGGLAAFLDLLKVDLAYTYNHFRYGKFLTAADDYSGNSLPSVPSHTISFLADINFYKGLFLQANYYYASEIFLNDANTSTADPYHLAGLRTGWKSVSNKNHRFQVYIGVDNLFDKTYSLGNDINAPAGRFFNAAPRRNYFGGISWQFLNSK